MPDENADASANTQAFRAFVESPEPAKPPVNLPLVIGCAVGIVLVVALLVWLALL